MGKILYRKEKNEDNILCRTLLLMVKGKGNNYIPNSDYACRTRKKKTRSKNIIANNRRNMIMHKRKHENVKTKVSPINP